MKPAPGPFELQIIPQPAVFAVYHGGHLLLGHAAARVGRRPRAAGRGAEGDDAPRHWHGTHPDEGLRAPVRTVPRPDEHRHREIRRVRATLSYVRRVVVTHVESSVIALMCRTSLVYRVEA